MKCWGSVTGALIIFADDAEYIGTNGWFRLKFQNQPDRVFERVPDAEEMLVGLITDLRRVPPVLAGARLLG